MRERKLGWLDPLVHSLSLTPLALLVWDYSLQRLGPHPADSLTHSTGFWALTFLLLSLAITPLSRITGQPALFIWRRSFGLYSFLYAAVHFAVFVVYEEKSWGLVQELVSRQYTMAGVGSLAILAALAATSTKGAKKLLKKNWRKLHFLSYFAAFLAVLHFFLLVKSDFSEPLRFAIVLGILMMLRLPPVARFLRKGRRRPS